MSYNRRTKGIKIEITIRDDNFRRLDTFKFSKVEAHKFGRIMKDKYGISFIPGKDKDLDWLK